MYYYNAKSKVIMKGRGSRGVRGVRRSRRGGWRSGLRGEDVFVHLGGGKRTFRKRTCRSKSRCGGAARFGHWLGGGSRGVRGVRRSRRGGRVGGHYDDVFMPY